MQVTLPPPSLLPRRGSASSLLRVLGLAEDSGSQGQLGLERPSSVPGPAGEVRVATPEAEVLEKLGLRPRSGLRLTLFNAVQVTPQLQERSPLTCWGGEAFEVQPHYPGERGSAPAPCFLPWKQVRVVAPRQTHRWP